MRAAEDEVRGRDRDYCRNRRRRGYGDGRADARWTLGALKAITVEKATGKSWWGPGRRRGRGRGKPLRSTCGTCGPCRRRGRVGDPRGSAKSPL